MAAATFSGEIYNAVLEKYSYKIVGQIDTVNGHIPIYLLDLNGKNIIPTQAYRDEGLSYHYATAADYIDIKSSDKLAEVFKELRLPYVQGRVWTTDAIYRETKTAVAKRKNDGCIAVEMELAGMQAVCDFHEI